MTQEDIEAIRKAQSDLRALEERDRANLYEWQKANLTPLLKLCDHKYPWGESALRRDCSPSRCHICGKTNEYGL